MTLRDDMTLEEAQVEAKRRWPTCLFVRLGDGLYQLVVVLFGDVSDDGEGGSCFNATTPVGCLDQAIAAAARRMATAEPAKIPFYVGHPLQAELYKCHLALHEAWTTAGYRKGYEKAPWRDLNLALETLARATRGLSGPNEVKP